MVDHLGEFSSALAAFATDLGHAMGDVTLITLTEFGRRIEENGSGGTDHGFGQAVFLLGGGVKGGQVHGTWPGLAPQTTCRRRPRRDDRLPQPAGRGAGEALRRERSATSPASSRASTNVRPDVVQQRGVVEARASTASSTAAPRSTSARRGPRATGRPSSTSTNSVAATSPSRSWLSSSVVSPGCARRGEAHLRDRRHEQVAGHVHACLVRGRDQLHGLPLVQAEDTRRGGRPASGTPPPLRRAPAPIAVESASTVCTNGVCPANGAPRTVRSDRILGERLERAQADHADPVCSRVDQVVQHRPGRCALDRSRRRGRSGSPCGSRPTNTIGAPLLRSIGRVGSPSAGSITITPSSGSRPHVSGPAVDGATTSAYPRPTAAARRAVHQRHVVVDLGERDRRVAGQRDDRRDHAGAAAREALGDRVRRVPEIGRDARAPARLVSSVSRPLPLSACDTVVIETRRPPPRRP